MSSARLDIDLASPEDWAGRLVLQAIGLLRAGNGPGAAEACQRALMANSRLASTWSNLAAFALMTGNMPAAATHAGRALRHDPGFVAALVNASAASFGAGEIDKAGGQLADALQRDPGHAVALGNLGMIRHAQGKFDEAEDLLGRALALRPEGTQLALARALAARHCRADGQCLALSRAALALMASELPLSMVPMPIRPKLSVTDARRALLAAQDVLDAAKQPFFLMAGTLLALMRDGELMSHDKDIDLGIPDECDRDVVASLFANAAEFSVPPRPESGNGEPLWAFGVVHEPTGITVDLFFARTLDDGVLFGFDLPPRQVFGKVRRFEIGALAWAGRWWPVPQPAEQYLEDIYGSGWRQPDAYFDTVLSNPCRTPDSLPRAINIGLLRLADALGHQDWLRAHSLCAQLHARERMAEVVEIERLLVERCADLRA